MGEKNGQKQNGGKPLVKKLKNKNKTGNNEVC